MNLEVEHTSLEANLQMALWRVKKTINEIREKEFGDYRTTCTLTFSPNVKIGNNQNIPLEKIQEWIKSNLDAKLIRCGIIPNSNIVSAHIRIKEEEVLPIIQLKRNISIEGTDLLLSSYFSSLHNVTIMGIKHIDGQEETFNNIVSSVSTLSLSLLHTKPIMNLSNSYTFSKQDPRCSRRERLYSSLLKKWR